MAENYVYVGASKADMMDEQSTTTFSIGYGFSKVFSNCVMAGFSTSYHQGIRCKPSAQARRQTVLVMELEFLTKCLNM
ncbi:hypothetical protein [Sulfurimonas sp.]|uniref:hypothetical protein n=1 Tax=Sulfurimonas sp. TaxID=2022749 RepID=UPI0025F1D3CA|nr:hypothetical protein [Sulfurimonas sp.]MBW6488422.1 hypothetical protein [Sulfurimonas sp.]